MLSAPKTKTMHFLINKWMQILSWDSRAKRQWKGDPADNDDWEDGDEVGTSKYETFILSCVVP